MKSKEQCGVVLETGPLQGHSRTLVGRGASLGGLQESEASSWLWMLTTTRGWSNYPRFKDRKTEAQGFDELLKVTQQPALPGQLVTDALTRPECFVQAPELCLPKGLG